MDIKADKKKKLQRLSTYYELTLMTAIAMANPGYLNLLVFYHY